jgi:HAMP domain-containing protein
MLFDEGLRVIGNDGRLVVESPFAPGGRGRDFSRDDAWRLVLETGRPAISGPRHAAAGSGVVVLGVAVPLRDANGQVMGQLHGTVRVDGANIAGDLPKVSIGKGGFFVLLTRDRIRVSHPDPKRVLEVVARGSNRAVDRAIDEGFEGVTKSTNSAGVQILSAVKRVPAADWFLFASIPMDEVTAPLRATRPLYAWAVSVGALLLVVAVWLSLRRVTRPLVEMTDAVERIAESPTQGKRIGVAGAGEVARLAGSFDRLLEALDTREAERIRSEVARRVL